MSCTVRIEAARAALARAAWTRGSTPAYNEDAVVELLADIRQHCRAAGIDFSRSVQLSWYYTTEDRSAS